MLRRSILLTAISLMFMPGVLAQAVPSDGNEKAVQRRVRKLILVSDLENRIRELSFAAPRVMARCRIAGWLWNDEKDDIDRAEEFAVAAVDDMYKNRTEIPPVYFSVLSREIFSLLDRHSPQTARNLRAKYKVTAAEEEGIQDQLLAGAGGERAAVDAVIRSLFAGQSNDLQIPIILQRLKQRNSQERFRLLNALIASEEQTPGRLQLSTLMSISPFYSDLNVEVGTAARFARIVIRRTQSSSQLPFADFDGWLEVLNLNFAMIRERVPDLVQDVEVLRAVLTSRISQQSREARERNERINTSIDRLGTLIEEAEKTENSTLKYDLYRRAARLALEKNLFRRAADLTVMFGKVDLSTEPILVSTQKNEVGQMLDAVTEKALKAGDDSSALYAVDLHLENVRRAEGFGSVAKFYVDKGVFDRGRDAINSALRVNAAVENLPRRASIYFKLIPITQRIDPTSVFEVNSLAAGSINRIPSPSADENEEAESLERYVTSLMIASWNLLPMLKDYVKTDRNGAADLSGRIEKKEVRIFADIIMGIAALDLDAEAGEPKEKPGR